MTSLLPLNDATDLTRYGGKAAHLALLRAAGLPVVDGLVLPPDIADDELPAIAHALAADYAQPPVPGLICRSSAADEDSPTASFAGLLTSRYCPVTPPALLAALTAVRRSANSPAVAAYAATTLTSPGLLAVLIQPALRPYAAGVAALTRTPPDWQIEAVHGLAVPLVDGSATGEIHRPDQPIRPAIQPLLLMPGTAHELTLPPGEWVTVLRRGTNTRMKIATSGDGLLSLRLPPIADPVLTSPERDGLLELTHASAHALGWDTIDLEWVLTTDGTLSIVQARPLTRPLPPACTTAPTTGWTGIPASPGISRGPALHLRADTHVDQIPGSILICTNIGSDAAHALLHQPVAILATLGGPLCHAAIVARELSIPCVTALPAQITTLPNGQRLAVDGHLGSVAALGAEARPDPADLSPPRPVENEMTARVVRVDDLGGHSADARLVLIATRASSHGDRDLLDPDLPRGLLTNRTAARHPGFVVIPLTDAAQLLWPSAYPAPSALLVSCNDMILWQHHAGDLATTDPPSATGQIPASMAQPWDGDR